MAAELQNQTKRFSCDPFLAGGAVRVCIDGTDGRMVTRPTVKCVKCEISFKLNA